MSIKMLTIADLQGDKPKIVGGGNIKLGDNPLFGSWSTMKGDSNEIRYVKKYGGSCFGTCGDCAKNCSESCYVNASYRYGSVIQRHAVNATYIREDLKKTFEILDDQLTSKKKKFEIIRINQSGELTGYQELKSWVELATKHQETKFYVYTKNYNAVTKLINNEVPVPGNFTILISIWHDQGVKEFKRWKDLPYIKAFVYDDGEMHINPQTYCKAYDDSGRLDHNISCEKCKKCFNRNSNHKIIACKSH
jgi:hypothetical protein